MEIRGRLLTTLFFSLGFAVARSLWLFAVVGSLQPGISCEKDAMVKNPGMVLLALRPIGIRQATHPTGRTRTSCMTSHTAAGTEVGFISLSPNLFVVLVRPTGCGWVRTRAKRAALRDPHHSSRLLIVLLSSGSCCGIGFPMWLTCWCCFGLTLRSSLTLSSVAVAAVWPGVALVDSLPVVLYIL